MKILCIGADSPFTHQVLRALEDEGHEVRWLNERSGASLPLFWKLVRKVPVFRRVRNMLLGRRIVSAAENFRPDAALVLKGTSVKEPTLRRLRSMGIRLANWFPENGRREPYRGWLNAHIGLYDVFFCFDSELLERQGDVPNTRLVWLPFGVDPRVFDVSVSADDREQYACDVVFIGACYPERVRALFALQHLNLKIFGWKGWEQTELANRYHGPLDVCESAKAYRCAKICLNMNLEPPIAGVNVKTFEIAAAGGFQLTDFRDDLPRVFEGGREVAVFRSLEGLRAQVEHYLADEEARSAIARAGHKRALRDHTMRARVRQMMKILNPKQ